LVRWREEGRKKEISKKGVRSEKKKKKKRKEEGKRGGGGVDRFLIPLTSSPHLCGILAGRRGGRKRVLKKRDGEGEKKKRRGRERLVPA